MEVSCAILGLMAVFMGYSLETSILTALACYGVGKLVDKLFNS